jgi:hypothetical protein
MRYVPAVLGWIMVAAIVVVAVTSAPRRTNAIDVVLAEPPPRPPSRPSATVTTTTPPAATVPRTTTAPATTTSTTTTSTTNSRTTTDTIGPTTTSTTTSLTTTSKTGTPCSSPDLSGPVTATFLDPCTGEQIPKWPRTRVDVPRMPAAGGVGIVVHTLTDDHGNESDDHYFAAGIVTGPGTWDGNTQVGLHCRGDRTRAELKVYEFTATGWAYFTAERPSEQEITIPADSKLLDTVTITRTDEPAGSTCEDP